MIRSGQADVMITGGAESVITPLAVAGFAAMESMTMRTTSTRSLSKLHLAAIALMFRGSISLAVAGRNQP